MTKIEWTDETWNPLSGCAKISAGCKNCYAADIAHRFWGDRKFSDVLFHPERLEQPLRWRKPRKVFVNSMSDLFHESVSFDKIAAIFGVMSTCTDHTFQVLTKRPDRMSNFFEWLEGQRKVRGLKTPTHSFIETEAIGWTIARFARQWVFWDEHESHFEQRPWPLPNVWVGVTCENQKAADQRIPLLQKVPAAVRFVSFEPLLEPIVLDPRHRFQDIQWGIVGGESGPKARKCAIEWIDDLAERHKDYGVACFVKQLGSKSTLAGEPYPAKGKGGDISQWPESIQVRHFPEVLEVAS